VQLGAYVYYASASSNPGVVSRFRLDVTLTATPSRSLGWTSSNAIVPFPNPGTTVRRSSQLLLNSSEIGFQSGFTDGTYLYYVANAAYGQMVRIDPVTFTRVDAVSGSSTGTNNWYCVASSGGYAYVGTTESTNARILRIKLSSMTVTGTLTLTGHSLIITAELVGNFVYFATHEATPFIAAVNITNSSFSVSQTMTVSTAYCQLIRSSGQYGGYIFFVCQMSPGRLMRFDYNTMKYSGYVAGNAGDNTFYAMAIVGSLAYVACGVNPGRLVKFNLATMAYIAGVSGVTGENYFLSVFVQGAYVYTTTNTSPSKIVRFDPKLMTRLFAVSGNPLTDSALLAPVQFGAYVYYASASSNPGVVSRFRLDVTLTGTHSFSEKSSKSRSSSAHSFSLANSQTYTTTLSHFPGSTSITCSFSESAISLSISMSPSLSPTQSTDSKSKTLSRSRGSQSGSASVRSTSSSPSVAARRATGTRTASSATASPSTSLSPTQSQSTDSRSNTLSRSRGSRSGSATLTSTSSSPTVAARRATGTRTASSATVTSSTSLLELSPTMVPTMMYMTFTGIAADKTVTFSRTLTAAASDSTSDSTNSITRLVSISAIVPVYINVTGDIFDSIVGEFISPGGKNETKLTVVAALNRNVVATRRAYFSTPKVTALKANGGVVSVRLRLLPQLTIRFSLTGQRVALGTEGLTATVVNQTDLLLSMRATGSQYLSTVANVNIPLANLLAGNARVTGSTELPIQFVLTATAVTALTVSTSIASVTGPISAIAGTTPASAMAVLRLSILIDILQCGFGGDDGGANLFSLTIGPSPGSSLRGAVVGNLVFIAAFVALLGILILAFLAYGWVTFNTPPGAMLPDLLNIFHFPGIVLIPASAVCQPTLTAAVQLIAIAPLNGDVTFGVLGAVALLLVLMLPYTVVIATQFCLRLVEKSENSGAHKQHAAQSPSLPRRIVSMLFSERATWQPIDPTRPDQVAWKKRFAPVFLDCSVWWYPLVDLWSGAAVGVVGGLTLGNTSVCLFQLAVVAFSYAFIALLQLAVAPPLVFASRCYVVMLQVLGLTHFIGVAVQWN
ncbi:transmembrane protein, putative, partial [Bodo saltans]